MNSGGSPVWTTQSLNDTFNYACLVRTLPLAQASPVQPALAACLCLYARVFGIVVYHKP